MSIATTIRQTEDVHLRAFPHTCFACCCVSSKCMSSTLLCTICCLIQVTYGACCQPAIDEPLDPVANPSTPGPICTATTESACRTLEGLTAWVKGKPCNGSYAAACSQDIKGACCYSTFKQTDTCYATECFSTRCENDVAWTDCVAAHERDTGEEGGQALKFVTGATCAEVSCPLPWES
jgi:hypothetical protein